MYEKTANFYILYVTILLIKKDERNVHLFAEKCCYVAMYVRGYVIKNLFALTLVQIFADILQSVLSTLSYYAK